VTRRRDPILAPNEPEFGSRRSLRRPPSTPRGCRLHHVVELGWHVSQGHGAYGDGLQAAARAGCSWRRWLAVGGGAGSGSGRLQAAARAAVVEGCKRRHGRRQWAAAAVVLLAVGFKSGCEHVIRRGPG
jgi:hypothetical protein